MTLRWLLAAFHLLALGIGLGAVIARGLALRSRLDRQGLRWVFLADAVWGVAAFLWLATGLWRLLGGVEKSTAYYLASHVFLTKMALFLLVFGLEVRPMTTLIAWRGRAARGEMPGTVLAPTLARLSFWQAGLVALMVFLATATARGYGA